MRVTVPTNGDGDADADHDERSEGWLSHPFTQRLASQAKSDMEKALARLISQCADSTDPKVVARVGEYMGSKKFADVLAGRWEKG